MDVLNTKMLRARSLCAAAEAGQDPNFESIEDTFVDMINYAAFAAAWCQGEIDGQDSSTGLFSNK